jgi:hypothetical protein
MIAGFRDANAKAGEMMMPLEMKKFRERIEAPQCSSRLSAW